MIKVAILLTVYNRREVTLKGLNSLFNSIKQLGCGYLCDVYMTDDGSTDGTSNEVAEHYPSVKIVSGNGSLFWGGGMNLAWRKALSSKELYDYFIWYNDDSYLYPNALAELFGEVDSKNIIVGAFCNKNGDVSYGGRNGKSFVTPNGHSQEIELMNGNLVIIPYNVYQKVGLIDKHLVHGEGDYDYGLRAQKLGIKVLLSKTYIGVCERHDEFIPKYCSSDYELKKRWKYLHSPLYSPFNHFVYNYRYEGFLEAMKSLIVCYIGVFFPSVYKKLKIKR